MKFSACFFTVAFLAALTSCRAVHAVREIATWPVPTQSEHIAGPVYYVGTKGIGAFLIETKDGLVLLDGGVPISARALVTSIKEAKKDTEGNPVFNPEDITVMLVSHAHFDHVGTMAYMKKLAPNAKIKVLKQDAEMLRNGGRGDHLFTDFWPFTYARLKKEHMDDIHELDDKEAVQVGELTFIPYRTPGHTRGNATWETIVKGEGSYKKLNILFVGSTTVLPGVRLIDDPNRLWRKKASYKGIAKDFEFSFNRLSKKQPDIFLAGHAEFFEFERKRNQKKRTEQNLLLDQEAKNPYIDPDGYKERIDSERQIFCRILKKQQEAATRNARRRM